MPLASWRDMLVQRWSQLRRSGGSRRRRRPAPLCRQIESLEDRTLLSGTAPFTMSDSYDVPYDSFDTAALYESSVLANDFDMESDPMTAVLVNDVSHGSLSLGSDGHFTYTPDEGYEGSDSFTYKAFDGTGYSSETTVSLDVSKAFSAQTNLDDRPSGPATGLETFGVSLLTGGVEVGATVAPGEALVYDSTTDPLPVIAVETDYTGDMLQPTPSSVEAQLTVGGITGDSLFYTGTLFSGVTVRIAQQIDAATLDTGRYDWEMTVIAHYSSGATSTRTFSGETNIVNRNDSEFGDNWSLAELDRLYVDTGGVLHVTGTGVASWFEDNGDGTFTSPAGPLNSTTLVQNVDDSYTLTDKYGNVWEFDSSGLLTERVDRNGNSTSYDYTDADGDQVVDELDTITDPFARETTFTYTSGLLTSVTDFAGRVTGLDHDASGRLIEVTAPDPDGAGPLSAPVTTYGYDGTSSRLTTITDPLSRTTDIDYDFAGRFAGATYADLSTVSLDPYQARGLVDTSTGEGAENDPADLFLPGDPLLTNDAAVFTDLMSEEVLVETDRFGYVTAYKNPLGQQTDYERDANGQVTTLTEPGSRVTQYDYDANGNLTQITYPDSTVVTWVYDTSINRATNFTDELNREWTFTYDTAGNLLTATDPLGNETDYDYDTAGRLTTVALPDPDDTGSLTSPVIGYDYDSYGRLIEVTNPDDTTVTYDWDTYDRVTSITDALGRETDFTYDNLDRLLTATQPDPDGAGAQSAPVWTWTYDAVGNRLTQVDPDGNTTSYDYDDRNRLVEMTLPDPDGGGSQSSPVWDWEYDAAGHLTSVTDPLGNETTYSYDNAGRLSSITLPDPDGAGSETSAVISYTRDSLGRVTTVNDEMSQTTSFEYDSRDRLTKRTDPDPDGGGGQSAPVTEWAWDDAGQLTSVTDPLDRVTSYEYDGAGRLTTTTLPDPDGAGSQTAPEYTLAYDNLGRVITSTDPLGNETMFEYDANSRLTKRTDADPDNTGPLAAPVTQWAYDDAGQLTSVTDPLGRVTSYDYDDLGRLTTLTLPDPDGAGAETSPVYSWTYDILGNVVTATDALGNDTAYAYDDLSRLTSVTQADPDDSGPLSSPVTEYGYDANGRLTSVTDPLDRVTTYEYDNLGRLITLTLPDPDGAGPQASPVYGTTYDKAGNVLTQSDALGNVTTYDYDNLQRLVSITQADPDGAGPLASPVTEFAYDAASQLTSVTDPLDRVTSYEYDDLGRLITTTLPDPDGAGSQESPEYATTYDADGNVLTQTDPLGNVTTYDYDNLQRLTSVTQPDPDGAGSLTSPVTEYAYDAASQLTSLTDPSGGVTSYEYDGLGRLITTTLPDPDGAGQQTSPVYSTTYDAAGNVATRTDPLGNVTTYDYDNLQRLTSVTQPDPDGAGALSAPVTQYAYDAASQLTSLTDPVGNVTTWAYDDLGRTTNETNELDDTRSWTYDAMGNVVTATDRNGRVSEFDYDNLYRLSEERWMDGQTAVHTIDYAWDAASQLGSVSDEDSAYAYTYDDLGRVTAIDNDGTPDTPQVVLTMAYDGAGRRTSLAAEVDNTDDFQNEYAYDNLGRLTQVEQSGQTGGNSVAEKRVDFAYNDLGQFDSITRYADLAGSDLVAKTDYTYDEAHRLTDLTHAQDTTTLADYGWTYDDAGRITQFTSTDGTTDFTYDDNGQLTAADSDYQADESYAYDENGNRTSTGYDTGDNNQLLSDGTYDYEYDAEGNRTKKTEISTGDYVEYTWDYRNRLTAVTFRNSSDVKTKEVRYTYDAFDRRISKSVDDDGDGTFDDGEHYLYDGSDMVLAFTDAGAMTERLLYGPNSKQVLASEDPSGDAVWMLPDQQGTVRDVATFDSGTGDTTVADHITYDSFGNITSQTSSSHQPRMTYTGQQWDADAGMFYCGGRWYDPAVGQFASTAPLGTPGSAMNGYTYLGNSPGNYVSPTGMGASQPMLGDSQHPAASSALPGVDALMPGMPAMTFTPNAPGPAAAPSRPTLTAGLGRQNQADFLGSMSADTGQLYQGYVDSHARDAEMLDDAGMMLPGWNVLQNGYQFFTGHTPSGRPLSTDEIVFSGMAAAGGLADGYSMLPSGTGMIDEWVAGARVSHYGDDVAALNWAAREAAAAPPTCGYLPTCFVAGTQVIVDEAAPAFVSVDQHRLATIIGLASAGIAIGLTRTGLKTDDERRRRKRRGRQRRAGRGDRSGRDTITCDPAGTDDATPLTGRELDDSTRAGPQRDQHPEPALNSRQDNVTVIHKPVPEREGAPTALPRRWAWLRRALTAAMFVCFGIAGWTAFDATQSSADATAAVHSDAAAPRYVTRNIEDVRLGERVVGNNPLRRQVEPDSAIEPVTWRNVRLHMELEGVDYDIALLRPLTWIDAAGAEPGADVHLSLDELGLDGPAQVLAVEECPPIELGGSDRHVVTGTTRHLARNVIDLEVAGLDRPIGVTNVHPIWSEDRQAFVPAGELLPGEHLRQRDGTLTQVTRITPRRGPPEPVYNIEVDGQHVYHVAANGVLVHNTCPDALPLVGRPHGGAAHDAAIMDQLARLDEHALETVRKNQAQVNALNVKVTNLRPDLQWTGADRRYYLQIVDSNAQTHAMEFLIADPYSWVLIDVISDRTFLGL